MHRQVLLRSDKIHSYFMTVSIFLILLLKTSFFLGVFDSHFLTKDMFYKHSINSNTNVLFANDKFLEADKNMHQIQARLN